MGVPNSSKQKRIPSVRVVAPPSFCIHQGRSDIEVTHVINAPLRFSHFPPFSHTVIDQKLGSRKVYEWDLGTRLIYCLNKQHHQDKLQTLLMELLVYVAVCGLYSITTYTASNAAGIIIIIVHCLPDCTRAWRQQLLIMAWVHQRLDLRRIVQDVHSKTRKSFCAECIFISWSLGTTPPWQQTQHNYYANEAPHINTN